MGSAAKESGLCWVFREVGTLAARAAGGDPGLGEVTEEQVCPWWHCLDCVPSNHLTWGLHGLPTVTQKAVFPHHFLGEDYGAPGISEGSGIQGFQRTLLMSFPS